MPRSRAFAVLFYAINLIAFYIILIPSIGIGISERCKRTWRCSRYLKGTHLGYTIDLADGQWREFRGSLWILWATLLGVSLILRNSVLIVPVALLSKDFATRSRKELLTYFRLVVGVIVMFVQHGWHSGIIVAIATIGFLVSSATKRMQLGPFILWLYALVIILFKESYRLNRFGYCMFLVPLFDHRRYGGMYGWQLPANFLVLRILSFGFDYRWAFADHAREKEAKKTDHTPADIAPTQSIDGNVAVDKNIAGSTTDDAKQKSTSSSTSLTTITRDISQYSYINYMTYVLYAPLYMAGPIITFNDFQDSYSKGGSPPNTLLLYGARWILCLGLFEFLSNKFHMFAIINAGLFPTLSAAQMAVGAYITLKLMWIKFLLIWRFFRLWALADGVDPPENMLRCMSNNYSLEQFWRGWHASFNKWIVRYMYVPMGGRDYGKLSVWVIFLFVAIWHDIELKLLIWGALNSVFFILERFAKYAAKSDRIQTLPYWLQHIIFAASGSMYILVLITVNLVGYTVGVGGVANMIEKFCCWEGVQVLLVAFYFLSVGTSIMMFMRKNSICQP